MQVEINNFRCWKKHSVQFNEKGIILINGTSGSGKSSIINAIFFAITGIGTKIVSYGEKKCSVVLKFNNGQIKEITRTKSPCRLTVKLNDNEDSILEDEEGQKYIDSVYGNNFQQTSYMTQKMIHSFLSLSPIEKMNFLQKFAFESDPVNNTLIMKKKCKEKILELKKESIEHQSKIKLYENEINIIENKLKTILKIEDSIDNENLCLNLDEYFKQILKIIYNPLKIKQLRTEQIIINELFTQYNKHKIQEIEYIKQKDKLIKETENCLKNKLETQCKINFTEYKGDENYQYLKDCKTYYITQNKYNNIINNIECEFNNLNIFINEQNKFLNNEKNKLQDKKNNIYNNLVQVHNNIDYIKNNIDKWNKSSQTMIEYYNFIKEVKYNIEPNSVNNIDTLTIYIQKLKNEFDELKQILLNKQEELNKLKHDWSLNNQLHKCPKCNISLRFQTSKKDPNKQKLVEESNILLMSLDPETYKQNTIKLQEEIENLNKNINNKQKEIYDKESEKTELINFNTKLENFKKRINRADEILIKYMEFDYNNVKNINNIQNKINNINKWLDEYKEYSLEIENVNNKINKLNIYNIDELNFKINIKDGLELIIKNVSTLFNKIKILSNDNNNEIINKYLSSIHIKIQELNRQNVKNTQNKFINPPSLTLEEIDNQLLIQTKLQSENEHNKQTLNNLTDKYILLNNNLQEIDNKLQIINNFLKENNDIQNKYNNIEKEINECYKEEEEYNRYTIINTLYNDWKRLKNEQRIDQYLHDTLSNDIVIHEIFLNKINESESIALTKCIDSINYYINDYLEKFFPNDSMIVDIVPFKEKIKNGKSENSEIKPGIDIKVCYKGEEVELSSLSGGEYDRVSLAIMLSFNHICKSDIILLDESISSLDADLTNDILEKLKENLVNKRIIVVAHQLSTGIFDQIINTK
jgi:DNA repair exonuclease SbcCD ATPase subunit